jgi:hypothetical protein
MGLVAIFGTILSAASEKLQINFSRSLWLPMLANVTMRLLIAAAAYQLHQDKKENPLDIKKFEALCSLPWSSTGFSRLAGSRIRINSHGSVGER